MKRFIVLITAAFVSMISFGQQFEQPKLDPSTFEDVKVKVGADFAIQLQMIDHEADVELIDLKNNFNLPTANLNLITDLAPGIQLHMNTYLSSRHHNEAWVEGGYLLIDNMPFFIGCR